MWWLSSLFLALLMSLPWEPASSQELAGNKLQLRDVVPIEGQPFPSFIVQMPLKCDAGGNVYLRWYERGPRADSPIVRISNDGKETLQFSVRVMPGFEEGAAYDFAVSPQGDLYLLAAKGIGETYVGKFNKKGEFDSVTRLEPHLLPSHMAVFSSGQWLVSGRELSPDGGKPTGRLLLALYDEGGRFLREISLPRDIQLSTERPASPQEAELIEDAELAFSGGNLEPGDDGNIYLMRAATIPAVYVIAPDGAVLRRLVIQSPGQDWSPTTMKTVAGRIAIEFARKGSSEGVQPEMFSIIDAQTGEKLADYLSTPEVGGAWACFTAARFTFLGSAGKPRRMSLIHVSP